MIVSDIQRWDNEREAFSPVIGKAVDYLRKTDFAAMEPGDYPIEGDDFYCSVKGSAAARPKAEALAENHLRYVDVHYLLAGEEWIGVARDTGNNEKVKDEMEARDYALYKHIDGEFDVILKPGMFAVLFPGDLHRPMCGLGNGAEIRKVVLKIHTRLFR